MTEDLKAILGAHPFFYGMESEQLETLALVASPVTFATGSEIMREGDEADACYLILEGDAALEIGVPGQGPQVIQTLHAGEILGWSWLFPPYRWTFGAQALSPIKAIRFDGPRLREAKADDPVLKAELMGRFAEVLVSRLQAARLQLMDVYGTVG